MDHSKYAIAIIKPDAHRDILAEMIQEDIQKEGLDIVFRKNIIISRDLAEGIYSDIKNEPNFRAGVESLVGTEKDKFATLLIVKDSEGDALIKLQAAKGKAGKGGIRQKYKQSTMEELLDSGLEGEDVAFSIAENRLHVPDSDELGFELARLFLTKKEINELEEREPEFSREINSEAKREVGRGIKIK